MTLRMIFLRIFCLAAFFAVVSVLAPGEAQAHAGPHPEAAVAAPLHVDPAADDAFVAERAPTPDAIGRGCVGVCCAGMGCCPSAVSDVNDVVERFPAFLKLVAGRAAPWPDRAYEPLPEPPRSFV